MYDAILKSALEEPTNSKFNENSWSQATLPIYMGGMGFRSAVKLSLPAYLASVNSTASLISLVILGIDISYLTSYERAKHS